MYASFNWLKELCPFDEKVERVAELLTSRGLTVDGVQAAGDDYQLEIDIPANRPDCLGHLGLARELAAGFDVPLVPFACQEYEASSSIPAIRIDTPELCNRFTASIVRGVKTAPSPAWVVRRLEVCGIRSINNVVDVSNLVMLECGNPIHFYDLDQLHPGGLIVRLATDGEIVTTLDGQERTLDNEMLVIADAEHALGLAGVMGGQDSEVSDATSNVLIESAWFSPNSIRRTARKVGLHTDASHRFERGTDREGVRRAQTMACKWLVELCGGNAESGWRDEDVAPVEATTLRLRSARCERLLGYRSELSETEAALEAIGLAPKRSDDADGQTAWAITVPSWRVDLEREADLVEEVARHLGYDRIPTSMSGLPTIQLQRASRDLAEQARDRLTALGLQEAFGYAMIAEDEDSPFVETAVSGATSLNHPIVETMSVLRRSILPGLIRAAERNQRRGNLDLALYEVGKVFHPRKEAPFPLEAVRVGIVRSGARRQPHWGESNAQTDLYDMMGIVEDLLSEFGALEGLKRRQGALDGFHPGMSAHWHRCSDNGATVAWAGALHPNLHGELTERLWIAEIDLSRLPGDDDQLARYSPIPRLGAVERDLAVVVPDDRGWGEIQTALDAITPPVSVEMTVVDRYRGKPLAENEAAITLRFRLQPSEESLTEAVIEDYRTRLIACLTDDLGLQIRG